MTKVAIVITCFEQADFVSDAISSVISQTDPRWLCAVLFEERESASVIRNAIRGDRRFLLIPVERLSLPASRNMGLANLRAQYAVALDADDRLAPTYLEKCIEAMDRNTDARIVYSRAEMFGDEVGEFTVPPYSLEQIRRRNVIFSSALFLRDSFDRVGGYDENLVKGLEDWDLWLSILKLGGTVIHLPGVEFFYRRHYRSMFSKMKAQDWEAARQYLRRKHAGFIAI